MKMSSRLICTKLLLLLFIIHASVQAFTIISSSSNTHQNITVAAILQKSAEVCSSFITQQGGNFVQPNVLTPGSVAEACQSRKSAASLTKAIVSIAGNNALVDGMHVFDPEYHFDDESFVQAQKLITDGVATVKASLLLKNYDTAREKLGKTLHTLQDFYSHSNWIELGNRSPNPNLIKPNTPIGNIADVNTETCSSCGDNCTNNILPTVLAQNTLTSGYFNMLSSNKPKGKCSHGGTADKTSFVEPKGGINKDSTSSPHGSLHFVAADVAIAATKDLLQDIRETSGDKEFLRLMGIFPSSSGLCFVIVTSVSTADLISEVKSLTAFIIDSRQGTTNEPSSYILVPFSDTGFGPLTQTTDFRDFNKTINALSASGGGNRSEMSLSGLWLALAAAPAGSEIFLFTNAEAKDVELKSTVLALIESMKFTVNVMLTNALSNTGLLNPVNQLYEDLALASGGQVMVLTKDLLTNVTTFVSNSTISALVNIFQVVRNPGREELFSFVVDSSVTNLQFYIRANSTNFTITSPSEQSQKSQEIYGSLGVILTIGNIYIVQLKNSSQAGRWFIYFNSSQSYTLKVIGQSAIDFQFNFVTVFQNPHPGYTVLNSRPPTDGNITLLLSILGSGVVKPTDVSLVEALDSTVHTSVLRDVGNGDYLVTVSTVPLGAFYVRVIGYTNSSLISNSTIFQRQYFGLLRTSNITVTALGNDTWAPGTLFTLPFTVATRSGWQNYTITARNNLQFSMTFPSSLTAGGDGVANGTVYLTSPTNVKPGSEVILTIEAALTGGDDYNYAVLRLAVSKGVAPSAGLVHSLWISGTALFINILLNIQI
ncbi:von Willebrand factor A domain-containing protein 7-like isoform X1 [Brachyhypopomus gauderio]|uniref:von Willebrand factor A domain-containing protein 7-like isoform X1 n=1 Tax=Brachyhypopomus gauderio TaxID=698409 RepID=UPI004041EA72